MLYSRSNLYKTWPSNLAVLIFLILILLPNFNDASIASLSSEDSEKLSGPGSNGSKCRYIVIDPFNPSIFYGGAMGFFRTMDQGLSWESFETLTGAEELPVYVTIIAPDPAKAGVLYAGTTMPFNLYKTTNRGDSWSKINLPSNSDETCTGIVIGNNQILVSSAKSYYNYSSGHIFASADNGSTWNSWPTPQNLGVTCITFDPTDINSVFVGTSNNWIFVTRNQGQVWERLSCPTNTFDFVNDIAYKIYPEGMKLLLVRSSIGARSLDDGHTWTIFDDFYEGNYINGIGYDAFQFGHTSSDVICQTRWANKPTISVDRGNTWQEQSSIGLYNWYGTSLALGSNNTMFYATYGAGPFKSTDNGQSWQDIGSSLQLFEARSLAFSPDHTGFLAGSAGGGVWRSTDKGLTWNRSPNPDPLCGEILDIEFDPSNTNVVWAGEPGGFYRSSDSGKTWDWAPGFNGRAGFWVFDIAFAPANPDRMFIATEKGLRRSLDHGLTWQSLSGLPDENYFDVAVSPVDSSVILTGSLSGRLFLSQDGGGQWKEVTASGMSESGVYQPWDIYFQSSKNRILAATVGRQSGGVWISEDGGNSWIQKMKIPSFSSNMNLIPFPQEEDAWLIQANNSILKINLTSGSKIETRLGPVGAFSYAYGINKFIVDPDDEDIIYAGTAGRGIWKLMISAIEPPLNLAGIKIQNRSLSQAEYINVLRWQNNPNNVNLNIIKYRIYLIEELSKAQIAELSSNIFEYQHRNIVADKTYTYEVTCVLDDGREGKPARVTIK